MQMCTAGGCTKSLLGSGCPASHALLRALLQEALAEADNCRNTEIACSTGKDSCRLQLFICRAHHQGAGCTH